MDYGDSDIRRLLAVFRGEIPDRVPKFEFIINRRNVSAILGPAADRSSEGLPGTDAVLLARKTGMDAVGFGIVWPFGRVSAKASDGSVHYSTGSVKGWSDLGAYQPYDVSGSFRHLEDLLQASLGTGVGVWVYIHSVFDSAVLAMGYHDYMLKLYDDLRFIEALCDLAFEFYHGVMKRLVRYPLAFIHIADDVAHKTGLLVRPDVFRHLWVERTRKLIEPPRRKGIPLTFHSDGNYEEIIPDLVQLGFCAINPLEPIAMDIFEIKRRFGDRLCLMGNIDIAGPLAFGEPEDVRREVEDKVRRLGLGGRYVCSSSHSITDGIPPRNFAAMVDAVHRYGGYA
ncbi:MAG: hypothetical protein HYY08_02290 [Firmicutes bacterium]|nr:hypothetical protein [Bacillota bacterium]